MLTYITLCEICKNGYDVGIQIDRLNRPSPRQTAADPHVQTIYNLWQPSLSIETFPTMNAQ